MSSFKVTWHIGVGNLGAREFLYWNDSAAGLAQCVSDAIDLSRLRLKLLSKPFRLDGVSIDGIPTFGPQRMLYSEIPVGLGTARGGGADCAPACYYIRLADGTHKWHRTYHLHGVPANVADTEDDIAPAGKYTNTTFLADLAKWIKELGAALVPGRAPPAQRWSLFRRGATDNSNLPRVKVLAVGIDGPSGKWQIVTPASLVVKAGDKIHIHGITGCGLQGLNGDVTVKKVTPSLPPLPAGNVLVLNKTGCCVATVIYNGKATAYKVTRTFTPIKFAFPSRVVFKKLGPAEFAHPGKARKGACCT